MLVLAAWRRQRSFLRDDTRSHFFVRSFQFLFSQALMGMHSTSGNQEKTSQRVRKEINGFSDVHRAVLDLEVLSFGSESIERINLLVKNRFFSGRKSFCTLSARKATVYYYQHEKPCSPKLFMSFSFSGSSLTFNSYLLCVQFADRLPTSIEVTTACRPTEKSFSTVQGHLLCSYRWRRCALHSGQ